jgi:superfamily II DNA or RNA helicase
LEIKIAVVKKGIEHQKIGILEDEEGDIISFSGSENETVGGWLHNDEQFHVFCSWKEGDLAHLNPDVQRFNILWNDEGKRVRVYGVSEAFNKGLIQKAPKDSEEFIRISKEIAEEIIHRKEIENLIAKKKTKKIKLREYQEEAISKWFENDSHGIFEMATGTGKTFTALGCVKEINKEIGDLVVVISVPYTHLVKQWLDNINDFDMDFETLIADSSNYKWKSELMDKSYDIRNKVLNKLIILTTHTTFAMPDFIDRIKKIQYPILLICDEVHGIGSIERRKGLIGELYKYRLGLSATPSRWFDEEGTDTIMEFFKDTVYEFSLKKAINTINPDTGKTFLVKYDYIPLFVKLTESELQEYEEQTKKIARSFFVTKDKKEKDELFNLLCIKRQKIITNSREKYHVFKELIKKIIPVNDCLVYVSPEQMDRVQSIISEFDVRQHKFTSEEGIKPEDKYGGLSERDFLLKEFEKRNYSILVAMKCLDEGVDVKSARTAIILASTGNPKEYIQRRGRILRPYPNKDKAVIYDFIVVPPIKNINIEELHAIEMKIFEKEMKRYKEFADSADNRVDCLKKVIDFEGEIFN